MAAALRKIPLDTVASMCQSGLPTKTIARNLVYFMETQSSAKKSNKREVYLDELSELLGSKPLCLVDVRDPNDLDHQGAIPHAINIPITELKHILTGVPNEVFHHVYHIPKPSKLDQDFILYGHGPNQGITALEIAFKLGYKKARHFPGGWMEWSSRNASNMKMELNK